MGCLGETQGMKAEESQAEGHLCRDSELRECQHLRELEFSRNR